MKKSLSSVTGVKLVSTRNILNRFTQRYGQLPIPKKIRNRASSGEMLLAEALSAYNRKEHQRAFKKCILAEKQILQAENTTTDLLKEYFKKLPAWRSWISEAIARSKSKRTSVIIVDKMAHTCKVYVNGVQRAVYDAELGSNWLGDKKRKGDRATPEGKYHVTMKKGAKQSKYYKALLINYPNEDDRREFKGGGLIEIHGHGGKGANWTEGCVALQNRDIDHLFNIVSVGTPVIIVGTLSEPPEYLQ
jgi:murein L,D-transpeptidase YafK